MPTLISANQTDPDSLSIAWLLAFPRSGATYTSNAVSKSTRTATATNYGKDPSISFSENRINGPYLANEIFNLPQCQITSIGCHLLTRTHCGGFCANNCPEKYVLDPATFFTNCVYGIRVRNGQQEVVHYDGHLVKKAVHLIRNPFDNIVSRFLHLVDVASKNGDKEFVIKYSRTKEGFQNFCKDQDAELWKAAQISYLSEDSLSSTAKDVPCFGEFFKYAQWHNNAFFMARTFMRNIPFHILYFEDLAEDSSIVLPQLLTFLGLTELVKLSSLWPGGYWDYYTEQQKMKAIEFIDALSSDDTRMHISERYSRRMALTQN